MLSLGIPLLHGVRSPMEGAMWALVGGAGGYFLLWGVVEAGKLAFGKKRVVLEKAESFTWTRHGQDADFVCGEEKQLWSDFFARESDRLLMKCPEITIKGERFEYAEPEFHYNRVRIGEREWLLEQLDEIRGTVTEIVIPREAMGFGDVLLLAMIGSFLGWKAVLFTIVAASVIGTLFAVVPRFFGRTEWSARIPFGPYLAAAGIIALFWGPQLTRSYLGLMT